MKIINQIRDAACAVMPAASRQWKAGGGGWLSASRPWAGFPSGSRAHLFQRARLRNVARSALAIAASAMVAVGASAVCAFGGSAMPV